MPEIRACYIDTSALAKWYLPEAGADEFAHFVVDLEEAVSSRLAIVELRCLLARKRRAGLVTSFGEQAVYRRFTRQIAQGYLEIAPVPDSRFMEALDLIEKLADIPLRTLDALHLAAARAATVDGLATADRVMAEAGRALGLEVAFFGVAA